MMGSSLVTRLFVFGLLFSILTCTAWAQSTAQVSGTVKDQSGAVLPGVEVTMTQTETGLTRNAITDETGSYALTNLPVGPYRLEAMLPGFRSYVQTGIVLQVSSNPILNAVLEVGQVSEQIEVQADAALVETRSTGVGQVIDNVRVLELPLNGRQTAELILLSGAAVSTGVEDSGRSPSSVRVSVAGAMDNGMEFRLDGATNNDPTTNFSLPMPFPEALQEFKVETSALPAQYGHHSGGAVNAVTKSGTNAFHGAAFEYLRNSALNARNAFSLKGDGLKRNQFGGTFGGPVVGNKLFFFGGHQSTIKRAVPSDNIQYIPTAAMVAGDFTTAASPACNSGRQITLRPPFANNRIDPALLSRAALNVVKLLPTTDDPCGKITFGRPNSDNEHQSVGKVDYQRSDKHSLFFRYQFYRRDTPAAYDGKNLLSAANLIQKQRVQSGVLGDTYLLGPNTVSSFRAMFGRTLVQKNQPQDYNTFSDVGVKNYYLTPGFPKYIYITSTFTLNGANTPSNQNATMFQFSEDLSLVRGSHQFAFGGEYINTRMNTWGNVNTVGQMQFGAQQTGLGLGDFMLGRASSWLQGSTSTFYQRQNSISLYTQDTWKATSKLTVNAGVRWEPFLPFWEKRGKTVLFDQARFDQGVKSTIYRNAPAGLMFPGDPGFPETKKSSNNHWLNFAPRVGLALDPSGNGRMTLRASYGVFYDFPHFYQYAGMKEMAPWANRVEIPNPPGGFDDPWLGYPGGNPFPITPGPDMTFPAAAVYVVVPREIKTPYSQQWSLSLQRQIGADWLITGNYLGSNVTHFWDETEGNPAVYVPGASCVIGGQPFSPCSTVGNTNQRRQLYLKNPAEGKYYGYLVNVDDGGTRNFNGMLLSIQRRRSNGITLGANYTLSHCIDDGTISIFQNTGRELPERRGANRGNCEQDRRHNFNLNTVYETREFANTTLRLLGSGWQVSGIVRLISGSPLTILSGVDNALSATADQRANQVLASAYHPDKSLDRYLNTAAFAQPATGAYGTSGVNSIRGPGRITIDMGLTRKFQVRENHSIEFRAEAFNVPNHLNPGNPTVILNNSNFGRIQSAGDPRIMQFALKYVF
jgi:hypothetical protein